MESSIQLPEINRSNGIVTYYRQYAITPFLLPTFPMQRDRFSVVVIGNANDSILPNFLRFVLNLFINEVIIKASTLAEVKDIFTNFSESRDVLHSKVALLDLSKGSKFAYLDERIIPAYPDSCLDKLLIRRILMPNLLLQNGNESDPWCKHYSHTVWFADEVSAVPRVVLNTSSIIFALGIKQIKDILKLKMGTEHLSSISEDVILACLATLNQDVNFMTMVKSRFNSKLEMT